MNRLSRMIPGLVALMSLVFAASPAFSVDYLAQDLDNHGVSYCESIDAGLLETVTADRTLPSGLELRAGDRIFGCSMVSFVHPNYEPNRQMLMNAIDVSNDRCWTDGGVEICPD